MKEPAATDVNLLELFVNLGRFLHDFKALLKLRLLFVASMAQSTVNWVSSQLKLRNKIIFTEKKIINKVNFDSFLKKFIFFKVT